MKRLVVGCVSFLFLMAVLALTGVNDPPLD